MFSSKLYVVAVALITIGDLEASPHHHRTYIQDEEDYRPIIRLLKALRRENRYASSATGASGDAVATATNKPSDEPTAAGSDAVTTDFLGERPTGSPSSSSGSGNSDFTSADQIQKLIQQAQQSGSGSGGLKPYPTSVPPERIAQINRGVGTILDGVGSLSLERILRGSFMFTRNENVKSVANNVLDSIFGARTPFTNGGGSDTRVSN